MTDHTFDLVILGGGSGGYAAALRAAELGSTVALIEKDKVGGTCLHRGCIPTKALLHAGEVADTARDSGDFGILAEFKGVDMAAVNKYKDGVVSRLFKGLTGLIKGRGITVIEGEGRLTGPREVSVGDRAWTGRHIVLASGSYPKSLPGLDIDGERVITSEHAVRLGQVLPVAFGQVVDRLQEHRAVAQQPGTGRGGAVQRPLQARVADIDGEKAHGGRPAGKGARA